MAILPLPDMGPLPWAHDSGGGVWPTTRVATRFSITAITSCSRPSTGRRAARHAALAGARDRPPGVRRARRDHRQGGAVAGPRAHVRRGAAATRDQRADAPGQGPLVAQDPAGVPRDPQALLGLPLLGAGLLSRPPAATSPTPSYFSIWSSTSNLQASAGSGSVTSIERTSLATTGCWADWSRSAC